MKLGPSKELEQTIRTINEVFGSAHEQYWLCFGGLWGLVMNSGVIPDGDLDLCTYYGVNRDRIEKCFKSHGYVMSKAILDDVTGKTLYCGFNGAGLPHICLSFWYQSNGYRWYCHDENKDLNGPGVPASGYTFKGIPEDLVDISEKFRLVEWPGISGKYKIRVPRFPGAILDCLYEDWAYRKQRYTPKDYQIIEEKCVSYHQGGVSVPQIKIHINSMAEWNNTAEISNKIAESKLKHRTYLKTTQKK